MNNAIGLCLLLGLAVTQSAWAQNGRHLQIQSKADHYQLDLTGNSGTVGGKPADLGAFRDLLPMLTDALSNDCPTLSGKPDVTVREGGKTRSIYLKLGVVSDGKNCMNVSGQGLAYFPIHRDFLIGPKNDSLALKGSLKVSRQGVKVLDLKNTSDGWNSADPEQFPNWDFIDHFLASLNDFSVRVRVTPQITQDKPRLIATTAGNQQFEFYKIANNTWAVKKPKSTFLEISDDWSFWYDFEDALLEDKLAPQIRAFREPGKDKATRLQALESLRTEWSKNLRALYHQLLLDTNESADIRAEALERLKHKPSHETALVMAQFLPLTRNGEKIRTATQVLKLNEPKGPLYNPNGSQAERDQVLEYWSQWWKKNKAASQ